MKKNLILFILCIITSIHADSTFAKSKFNYSAITNDKKIETALDHINDSHTVDILNGENINGTPIRIEFKKLTTLGEQYKNNLTLSWINYNYNQYNEKKAYVTVYIDEKYKSSPKEAISIFILSNIIQLDPYVSINEEVYIASLQASFWMNELIWNPELANIDDALVHRLNHLKELYIQGNYTSKYLKEFVKAAYINLNQTSPGFEKEELFKVPEDIKAQLKNEQNNVFKISSSPLILSAIEEIKKVPEGTALYKKLKGDNYTKRPIKVEFIDLAKIDKNLKNCYSAWQQKNGQLYIYINNKYSKLPKEVIATLIVGRLGVDQYPNSKNKELYSWTLESASWSYFTKLNPKLSLIYSPVVQFRENLIRDIYEKGNYTDLYLKILIDKNRLTKDLPQTSVGFEVPRKVDNSLLRRMDSQAETKTAYVSTGNIRLKGYVNEPPIPAFNQKQFDIKIKNDNLKYQAIRKTLTPEQYHIYRIAERIIRANNIGDRNWRIGFDYDPKEVNAYATAGNLVILYSALYDSLYTNDDALAFIISHELSHLLLNHGQITVQNNYKMQQLQNSIAQKRYQAGQMAYNAGYYHNNTAAIISFGALALLNDVSATYEETQIDKIYEQERQLEYAADNEAFNLMYRAGYSIDRAAEAFEFLALLPNIYTARSTHPPLRNRQQNLRINGATMTKSWSIDGKNNILTSGVLNCKKSMDSSTIIIERPNKILNSYRPESDNDRYRRIGYMKYKNYNLNTAINYLSALSKREPNNFIHPLYVSYANEYLYRTTHDKKYLKEAKTWSKQAAKINSNNEAVRKQIQDLSILN